MSATLPTIDEIEAVVRRLIREELAAKGPEPISMEEAAERLGVSLSTIRRQVRSREIPSFRVGRQVRIDARELPAPTEEQVIDLAARVRAR